MKKLTIFPIMFILMMSFIIADDPPYASNQWGNTNYMGKSQSENLISWNTTVCQPFQARNTGTITSFYALGNLNGGEGAWCFSSYPDTPMYDCAMGNPSGVLNAGTGWLSTSGTNISYSVTKGTTYYLCIQGDTTAGGGGILLSTAEYDFYPNDEIKDYFGITTPYNSLWTEGYQGNPTFLRSTDLVGFSIDDETLRAFQYCMDSDEDKCNIYSGTGDQFLNGEQNNEFSGEIFQFNPTGIFGNNIDVTDISMMMAFNGVTGCGGSCTFQFEIYGWNWLTNTTSTAIYNSSVLTARNGSWTNGYYWQNHTVNGTVTLLEGNNYVVGARCISGCGAGLNQRMHTAYTQTPSSTDWFERGFQDLDGMRWDTGVLSPTRDTWFLLTLDETVRFDEEGAGVGNLSNCTTTCTNYSLPYYLKEDFIGDISTCDWVVNEQVCYLNKLLRVKADPYYTAFKLTELLEYTDSRYYTVAFDVLPADIDSDGWLGISLYDYDYVRYVNVLFSQSGTLYNNEGGNAVLKYSNLSTATSTSFNLHIDLTDDTFDIYYGGSLILSNLQFTNEFYNMENLYGLRITSSEAGFELENLEIYASNQDNQIIIPDEDLVPVVDETKSWCNLFNNQVISCSVDSDCETDDCSPTGYCNRFDMNVCDENGKTRGSYCMLSEMAYCGLTSTGDIILDNFFIFLVLIVIIMGLVYLAIMLRSG